MTPTNRALVFWVLRVGIAVLLVIALQAWRGPDPFLWWLAAGYAVLSLLTTLFIIRTKTRQRAEADRRLDDLGETLNQNDDETRP